MGKVKSNKSNRKAVIGMDCFNFNKTTPYRFKSDDYLTLDLHNGCVVSSTDNFTTCISADRAAFWDIRYTIRSIPKQPEWMLDSTYDKIKVEKDVNYDEHEMVYVHCHSCTYKQLIQLIQYIYLGCIEDMVEDEIFLGTVTIRGIEFQDFIKEVGLNKSKPGLIDNDNVNITYTYDPTLYLNHTIADSLV